MKKKTTTKSMAHKTILKQSTELYIHRSMETTSYTAIWKTVRIIRSQRVNRGKKTF